MTDRISSLDKGYVSGDISVFPNSVDNRESLYEARNKAETKLVRGLPFSATRIFVEDASAFPPRGLIRIGPNPGEAGNAELIYYDNRTDTSFSNLMRGFAGSVRTQWGSDAVVSNAVMAEHHNAVKDALLNTEAYLGVQTSPADGTFNAILHEQEVRFLTPRASFFAHPTRGKPPLKVRFQNFSDGDILRFFWDFGDGGVSTDINPIHTYYSEGMFTVKLNIITSTGGQGSSTKSNYVEVSESIVVPFFYVVPTNASRNGPWYSEVTAAERRITVDPTCQATQFEFVDQTDGNVSERYWIFADGQKESDLDPDVHVTTHTYASPGTYSPTLLLVFADQSTKRAFVSPNSSLELL